VARQRLLLLLLLEATLVPAFVFGGLMLFTNVQWYTAILFAAIAVETAPATILAIVKDTASKGAFVTTLIAAVGLNNLACITLFELARTISRSAILPPTGEEGMTLLTSLGQIGISLGIGLAIGCLLVLLTLRIVRTDRLSVLSLIAILLTAGLTAHFQLSVLLACLCLGITLANLTPDKEEIGHRVFDSFEFAIFAVFFYRCWHKTAPAYSGTGRHTGGHCL
jgi:Kef-type K+ transport system membrane component KefB